MKNDSVREVLAELVTYAQHKDRCRFERISDNCICGLETLQVRAREVLSRSASTSTAEGHDK